MNARKVTLRHVQSVALGVLIVLWAYIKAGGA